MTLEEAKARLDGAIRTTLTDHAAHDAEVIWRREGIRVADGYYSQSDGRLTSVVVKGNSINDWDTNFTGKDAWELRRYGIQGEVFVND